MRLPKILKVLSRKTSDDPSNNRNGNTSFPSQTYHGDSKDHVVTRDSRVTSHHHHQGNQSVSPPVMCNKLTRKKGSVGKSSSKVEEFSLTDVHFDDFDRSSTRDYCQTGNSYHGNGSNGSYHGRRNKRKGNGSAPETSTPTSNDSWWQNIALATSQSVDPLRNIKNGPIEAHGVTPVLPLASTRGDIKVFLNYKKIENEKCRRRDQRSMVNEDDPVFRQIFDMFDKNGDNVINVEELSGILEILGYSPTVDEVRTILERFDQDNSGTIDFDEYLILIQHWIEQDEEQIYEAFKVFDKDGDGFVSAQELKRALTQYGEQFTEDEANEFFNMMDTDGDGVINYEEFVEYLRSMQKYSADQ